MPKRVTIADVAELAGVHPATVSRALNGKTESQVNALTAKRVRRAAKQLGYSPNVVARGLRTSLSMTIGVIIPDLTNPIFPPVVRGIDSYLAPQGYSAVIVNTDGRDEAERVLFQSLMERQVDGFIIATDHKDHPLLLEAYERGVKVVLVNRASKEVPYSAVIGDDGHGIRAAVDHLVRLGHRSLLHLAGPAGLSTSRIRAQAFSAACAAQPGLSARIVAAEAYSVEAGQAAMDAVLGSAGQPVTAVVAGNDLLALGVYHSLRLNGVRCPEDVSVTGFNDMPFAGDFQPALTTVRAPFFDMGREAARVLLGEIADPELAPLTITMPVSLIVRGSTAPPPAR
jgi:LacI family transcriptional regulator